jgi:hypothetical protein
LFCITALRRTRKRKPALCRSRVFAFWKAAGGYVGLFAGSQLPKKPFAASRRD